MSAPVDRLIGDPTAGCKRWANDIAMHWWKTTDPQPGDTCQCGAIAYTPEDDE